MKLSKTTYLVLAIIVLIAGSVLPVRSREESPPSIRVIGVDEEPAPKTKDQRKPVSVNRVLAIVGDRAVTMNDFRRRYGDTHLTLQRMRPLVNELLVRETAEQRKLSPGGEAVNSVVDQQVQQFASRAGGSLDRVLAARGLTEQEYRSQLRDKVRNQLIENRLLSQYFPEISSPDTRAAPVFARARIMVVDDVSRAWQIYGWLRDNPTNETWNKLFEQYSKRLSLMKENGDIGWFQWGHYASKIEYRVFSSPMYSFSRPFNLRGDYALVYQTGYRIGQLNELDSSSRQVYQKYRHRYYRKRLFDRLREEMTVIYPDSIERRLGLRETDE